MAATVGPVSATTGRRRPTLRAAGGAAGATVRVDDVPGLAGRCLRLLPRASRPTTRRPTGRPTSTATRSRSRRPSRPSSASSTRSTGRSACSGPTATPASPRTRARTRPRPRRRARASGARACTCRCPPPGLMVGSGYYHMASDQLARFREAVDDDGAGEAIADHLRDPREEGPRDRRVRAAQDRTTGLRQGPPARRPAAAQGAGGDAVLPRGGLAAHRQGEGAGGGHLARASSRCTTGSTPTSARASCRRPTPSGDYTRRGLTNSAPGARLGT